jgi:probable HAF family extracellular repeat protein
MRMLSLQCLSAVAFVLGGLGAPAAQAGGYTIVDLGNDIFPNQVNVRGDVAGMSILRGVQPVVYRNGRLHWLCCKGDNLGDGYASAINDHGDVVGQGGDQATAIMWERGGRRLVLPLPVGTLFVDEVSGVALDGSTVGIYFGTETGERCFRTSPTGPAQDLGLMGEGDACEATAINKSGQVIAGTANKRRKSTNFHAFLWSAGTFQDLGTLPGQASSVATALNDHGQVVGYSGDRAFLWSDGQMMDLDPANEFVAPVAASINNSGVIVGYAGEGALRFDVNGPTLLASEVVNLDDWRLTWASSINDYGVIVGQGDHAGGFHAFMLVPLP